MARPIFAMSMTFMGVYGKYGQNVDYRWKRFGKRWILSKVTAKTKKFAKKGKFSGYFLCEIGRILKLVAAPQKSLKTLEIFFELVLGIDTAVCGIPSANSYFCTFCDTLMIMYL